MNRQHVDHLQKLILKWLQDRLDGDSFDKIRTMSARLSGDAEDWEVFSSFSAVPRYTGKYPLNLNREEFKAADKARNGWDPRLWTVDQLGRTLMTLAMSGREKDEFLEKLEKLFISSDMGEAEALYQSLAVLPYPEELRERAAEGIRSNITSVFNAVALRNPYPADYLEQDAWNQMVLKALFVESPLYLIQGIDRRANPILARMLADYAHERWSAGRIVSPELWRPVGPFIDDSYGEEIRKLIQQEEDIHKHAALLALSSSDTEAAETLLADHKKQFQNLKEKDITWADVGKRFSDHSQKL